MGREILKWIAIITMTVDHVGAVFYPDYMVLRVIGRLAFPLFCYLLVLGMESTRNLRNYFIRLLLFALVSQIPFFLAFGLTPFEHLNIFFTLSSGVVLIHFFKKNPLISLFVVVASALLHFDFGPYGIALIGCMYILEQNTEQGVVSMMLLGVLSLLMWETQIYSLFVLPIILLHKSGLLRIQRPLGRNTAYPLWRKYFFYVYYPSHLAMIYLIRTTLMF